MSTPAERQAAAQRRERLGMPHAGVGVTCAPHDYAQPWRAWRNGAIVQFCATRRQAEAHAEGTAPVSLW